MFSRPNGEEVLKAKEVTRTEEINKHLKCFMLFDKTSYISYNNFLYGCSRGIKKSKNMPVVDTYSSRQPNREWAAKTDMIHISCSGQM